MANHPWKEKIQAEVGKAVIGQEDVLEKLLVALLSNGHVLLEGMPGLAKTLVVKSLAAATGVQFERIQFTPDLLPSDIVGTMVFQPADGQFKVHCGPIFSNLVLADEINRAPAKVQSALLEAMQERQVTLGGETMLLPEPFLVMATQNPLEQEGTYPLPEAQTDRFLLKLLVDYPSEQDELLMMERWGSITRSPMLAPVSSAEEIIALRQEIDQVYLSPEIHRYILALVRKTRDLLKQKKDGVSLLDYGASPRASLALMQAVRALTWLRAGEYVIPEIIQWIAPDVLRHRIGLTYEALAAGWTPDKIIKEVIETVQVPGR